MFKFRYKIIRSDEEGDTVLAEGTGEREAESFAALKAAFMSDMAMVFPQEPHANVEYFFTLVL